MIDYDELFLLLLLAEHPHKIAGARRLASMESSDATDATLRQRLLELGVVSSIEYERLEARLTALLRESCWNANAVRDTLLSSASLDSLDVIRRYFPMFSTTRGSVSGTNFLNEGVFARGGLGELLRVREPGTGREVLLKRVQPGLGDEAQIHSRFEREAHVTAQLEHPNIVPVYYVPAPDEDSTPFYIMRLLQGHTLAEEIRDFHAQAPVGEEKNQKIQQLLRRLLRVCDAAAFAHDRGVIHRDIKPSNIICEDFGSTYLIDWGLVRLIDAKEEFGVRSNLLSRTRVDSGTKCVGTPGWMSPEQATGNVVDERSDIYAIGAVLFAILTGDVPHRDADASPNRQASAEWPDARVREQFGRVSRTLGAIACKAMAFDRAERYANVSALADDLDRWTTGRPVSCYREPWMRRMARRIVTHPSRSIYLGGALVVLFCCAALVGSAWWTNKRIVKHAAIAITEDKVDSIASSLEYALNRAKNGVRLLGRLRETLDLVEERDATKIRTMTSNGLGTFLAERPEMGMIAFANAAFDGSIVELRRGNEGGGVFIKATTELVHADQVRRHLVRMEEGTVAMFPREAGKDLPAKFGSEIFLGTKVVEGETLRGYVWVTLDLRELILHSLGTMLYADALITNSDGETIFWRPGSIRRRQERVPPELPSSITSFLRDRSDHTRGKVFRGSGRVIVAQRFPIVFEDAGEHLGVVLSLNMEMAPFGEEAFAWRMIAAVIAILVPIIVASILMRMVLVQLGRPD
ncbi:serine/threonine-protein kinase [Kolteria novifilia]